MIEVILEPNAPKGCVLRSLRERPSVIRVLNLRPLAEERVGHLLRIDANQKSMRRIFRSYRERIAEDMLDLPVTRNGR